MKIIKLEEVDSTNSYLQREASSIKENVMVLARCQTAGRGQRGNGWESAPGENLTFSVLYHPGSFRAIDQFSISEATSLAVVDLLSIHGVNAKVKWPNDIYVGDKKICGILIHNTLMGSDISYSILGVGININQTEFVSDAPNPVSLKQLTGYTYDLEVLTTEMVSKLECRLEMICGLRNRSLLHDEYVCNLWRGDASFHPFCDASTGAMFEACIDNIDSEGVLTLKLRDGSTRCYRFKEVSFVLE
ncbi:MAG: biotin--[acetyl-CoA-carboxylase] ligase [Muribaculum sp.]|nr:biotin--[acetyl-CoA-carboxylase] ligase [Muribaculum sp.]